MSAWPCGKRVFTLSGALAGAALEPLLRDSFRCKPDPVRDGKTRLPDLEFPLGPDFGLVDSTRFLAFQSLDGELITVTRFPDTGASEKVADEFMRPLLAQMAGNLGAGTPNFTARTRERGLGGDRAVWRGKARRDHKPVRLLAVEIRCNLDDYLAFYLGTDAFPERRALDPMLAARCTAHPQEPPFIADLAHLACAGGDQRGCTLKLER
jgi:hypothetical protein